MTKMHVTTRFIPATDTTGEYIEVKAGDSTSRVPYPCGAEFDAHRAAICKVLGIDNSRITFEASRLAGYAYIID